MNDVEKLMYVCKRVAIFNKILEIMEGRTVSILQARVSARSLSSTLSREMGR